MARYLAYLSPSRGHLYPLVPSLLELISRGHEVQVRTLAAEVEHLRRLGLAAMPVDPRLEAMAVDDWKARTPIGAQRREVATLVARAPIEIADLTAAMSDAEALIVDTTAWGAAVAAEASGMPWAYVAHFPLPLRARGVPPYGLGLPPRHDGVGRIRDALAYRLLLRPLERIVMPGLNALRTQHGLRPVHDADDLFARTAPLVLYFTAVPFEYPRAGWPDSVRLVGPGLWDPAAQPPAWLSHLDRPLLLVTCSTEYQDDGKLARTAIETFADSPYTLAVTTAAVDPATLPTAANAHIERFLPHRPLLERAAAVVCHAGMGITQKALAAGVPVCAVPFGRDQFEVARRVEVAGAGVRLPATRLSTARLREAVERTIAVKPAAGRLATAFAAAGGAAGAATALEELAQGACGHART